MNEILQLKGRFQESPNVNRPGYPNLPKGSPAVTSKRLSELHRNLSELRYYWSKNELLSGALIDVKYSCVIAKSNRAKGLLSVSKFTSNDFVVGAKFIVESKKKHVITYYIKDAVMHESLKRLEASIQIVDEYFGGKIDNDAIVDIDKKKIVYKKYSLSKSTFLKVIVDCHYIESMDIPNNIVSSAEQSIITLYQTDIDVGAVLGKIGIKPQPGKMVNDTSILLFPDEIEILSKNAPYLIAMATEDMSKLSLGDLIDDSRSESTMTIDSPKDEPIIGVIDTMFDESVYFHEWVEFEKRVSDEIELKSEDYWHGTAVSSIIVDGPAINPALEDGCGRFKVRHFGVAKSGRYSSFTIMRSIESIVSSNRDIKVWNLSLGSSKEVNLNSVSTEAATLDRIQHENNVIFIIAGTNRKNTDKKVMMIGSPADSINSIVVNSVTNHGTPATYARRGPVLSFFNKPDISSFGGDAANREYIRVCTGLGEEFCTGTSFSAPWVTRKVAYLIEVLGLSRELAKALIVDAAANWSNFGADANLSPLIGHGILPTHINDIIGSPDHEIKFVMSGTSIMYNTYTYSLPVPVHEDGHPFVAKATLCYFPKCSVNQGVDYTNTELDIYIGRITKNGFSPINKNKQSIEDGQKHHTYEEDARKDYRKWDNTKHIQEKFGDNPKPRKSFDKGHWGISIKAKERLGSKDGEGINFGLVITLKEINGVNRINDFIKLCELRGWLVTKIDVENRIEIYNKAQESVVFNI